MPRHQWILHERVSAINLTRSPTLRALSAMETSYRVALSPSSTSQPPYAHFFAFGRSTRTSRNSSGPLIKRRFRLDFSSLFDAPAVKLSIAFEASSFARSAVAAVVCFCSVPTVSPNSTRRRNASERLVSFAAAQASTSAINVGGIREVTCGLRPVAGRPRFLFGVTFIDLFIFSV